MYFHRSGWRGSRADGFMGPDWHEPSAAKENRIDRAETAKIFACKAGYYQGNNPWERALRANGSSAELP